jgi:Tfp pilus assembly protein PilX
MRAILQRKRRGTILAVALATLLVVTLLAGAVFRAYLQNHRQLRREQDQVQTQWLADSAVARALVRRKLDPAYSGETWQVELPRSSGEPAAGLATIKIEPNADQPAAMQIVVESQFPVDDVAGIRARRLLTISPTEP